MTITNLIVIFFVLKRYLEVSLTHDVDLFLGTVQRDRFHSTRLRFRSTSTSYGSTEYVWNQRSSHLRPVVENRKVSRFTLQ